MEKHASAEGTRIELLDQERKTLVTPLAETAVCLPTPKSKNCIVNFNVDQRLALVVRVQLLREEEPQSVQIVGCRTNFFHPSTRTPNNGRGRSRSTFCKFGYTWILFAPGDGISVLGHTAVF